MKKLESVFLNKMKNNSSLILVVLLFLLTIIIAMSSASAAYDTYTDISVDTVGNVAPYLQFNVSGTLYNSSNGAAISGKTITVTITNSSGGSYTGSATTNSTGDFRIPFVVQTSGLHNAQITFAGDTTCSPTTINMAIEAKRVATFFNITSFDNSNKHVGGYLLDENGNPLVNTPYNVTVLGRQGNTFGPFTGSTDSNGYFSTTMLSFSPSWMNDFAPANITLQYLGNQTYNPTITKFGITNANMFVISIDPVKNLTSSNAFDITGRLAEIDVVSGAFTYPSGVSISVYINGVFNQTVTAVNGNFIASFTGLSSNYYDITFVYNNVTVPSQTKNLTTNVTINIFVSKTPTSIEFNHPMDTTTGKVTTISGKLLDCNGNGIVGKTVHVYVNGTSIGVATTGADGSFEINHTFSSVGNHSITVVFDDSDPNYYYFNKTIEVGVELLGTNITVSNNTTNVTETVTINGTLTVNDDVKTPITGTDIVIIEIWLNGVHIKDYTVNVTNGIFSISDIFYLSGNYTVIAKYIGEQDVYNSSTAYGWLLVNIYNSTTTVSNNTTRTTEPVTINGTVRGSNGGLINDTITVVIRDSNGNIIYTNNSVIVTNGVYSIPNIVINTNGTYTVTATYSGNDTFNASQENGILTVTLMPSNITVDDASGKATDNVIIHGQLLDEDGNPIVNAAINVEVDNHNYTATTNATGHYSVTVNMPTPGDYPIKAFYDGDTTYEANTSAATLHISKKPTNLTVEDASGKATDNVIIYGQLLDEDGNPIVNAAINVEVDNHNYTATTNATGHYSVTVNMPNAGDYPIKAFYDGNTTYEGNTSTATLHITKKPTNITVNNANGNTTYDITVTGLLLDEDDNPIANANVNITIDGTVYYATTNSIGYYSFTVNIINAGTYTMTAQYGGNGTYEGNISTGTLTISLTNTNTFVTGNTSKPTVPFSINGTVRGLNGAPINDTLTVTIRNSSNDIVYTGTVNSINGVFTLNNIVLNDIGNYVVYVTYAGNTTYAGSSGDDIIVIALIDTNLRVSDNITYTTRNFNITGRLTEVGGNPIVNAAVKITILDGINTVLTTTVYTDLDGYYWYLGIYNISGSYKILAEYTGTGAYEDSTWDALLTIDLTPTSISLTNTTPFVYGRNTTFEGVLMDTLNNRPIAGAFVEIFVDGVLVANRTTNSTGGFSYVFVPDASHGTYNITVKYYDNPTYIGSDNDQGNNNIFAPREMNTYLVIQNTTTKPYRSIRVIVTLFNEFGERMAGETIEVSINGGASSFYNTNSNGDIFVPFTATQAGPVPISATYGGDTARGINGNSSSGIITVEMLKTSVVMTHLIVYANQDANIIGTLVDEDGNILANRLVDVYFEGVYNGTYITDSSGRIYIPLGSLPIGFYTISAHFEGDLVNPLIHAGSDSFGTVQVRPLSTTIHVSVNQKENESTTFVARLFDEFLKPIANKPVLFYLNGEYIGLAITDNNGMATLPYVYTPNGRIMSEFLGDSTYGESLDTRYFGINTVEKQNNTINDSKVIKPKVKGDIDNDTDTNGSTKDSSNGSNGKPVNGLTMLKTGNPIAMLLLCLLSVFFIGIRKRVKN